jgi:hypothetical protein
VICRSCKTARAYHVALQLTQQALVASMCTLFTSPTQYVCEPILTYVSFVRHADKRNVWKQMGPGNAHFDLGRRSCGRLRTPVLYTYSSALAISHPRRQWCIYASITDRRPNPIELSAPLECCRPLSDEE